MIANPLMRRAALASWDVACWSLAVALVLGVRLDFDINEVQWRSVFRYWILSILLLLAFGYLTKFYRGLYRVGSFDEAIGLAIHFGLLGLVTVIGSVWLDPTLPRSLPVLVPPAALLGAAAGRWFFRSLRDRSGVHPDAFVRNAVIYGAGDAGYQVLRLLNADAQPPFRVVGFIDDNPGKRHLRLSGVCVVGTGANLAEAARQVDAEVVILAVGSVTGEFIGHVQDVALRAGLEFLVLPRVSQLIGGRVELRDIRRVEIEDVLGRHAVTTDLTKIAGYLTGKRVLVTGAGGSIGSELCRQVHGFGPATLVMLDRDESALHAVQLSIYGHGLLDGPDTVLVDIRDEVGMRNAFELHRPEIVFHAAALKHLPMLERFPREGWKTNVGGTLNVVRLAAEFGVHNVVNISTDKAADSTSVLGSTKRLAERLTSWYANLTGMAYISVRFGNVLGSRGSMLHTFNAQIDAGGPVTVTHPDVTRYFMTIPEASELVIQAGAIGRAGEVLVLNMGAPVKILEVAKKMIQLSGREHVAITFTGLRPGEKMHEALFSDDEVPVATEHRMISSVSVPALDPSLLEKMPYVRASG